MWRLNIYDQIWDQDFWNRMSQPMYQQSKQAIDYGKADAARFAQIKTHDAQRSMVNNEAGRGAQGGSGKARIFAGDKFENQMVRNDAAKGVLDAKIYQNTYDKYANVANALFMGFVPGPSFSVVSKVAFNSKYIGASSKLFGYKPIGGATGTLNQGVVRVGWNSHGANYVFRGVVGHNPTFFPPTTILGKQVHWHTPSLFVVPKIGLK